MLKRIEVLSIAISFLLIASIAYAQEEHDIKVSRIMICESIETHEPVDIGEQFGASVERLYCFTELDGPAGEITHVWIHDGEVRAEVKLTKGADGRWRTWSSKKMIAEWSGEWNVEVRDSEGTVLESTSFYYGEKESQE